MADSAPGVQTPAPSRTLLSPAQWQSVGAALKLSPREIEVVQGLFDDKREADIAADLGISARTVHTHLERLYRKLDVHSRTGVLIRVFAEHIGRDGRTSRAAGR